MGPTEPHSRYRASPFLQTFFAQLHRTIGRFDHQQATRFQQTDALQGWSHSVVSACAPERRADVPVEAAISKRRIGDHPAFHIFDAKLMSRTGN